MTEETQTTDQHPIVDSPIARQPPAVPETMHARNIRIGAQGITFTNAAEVMAFSRMMAASEFAVPAHLRNNSGACMAVVDDAIRFGMSPYALARESYMVTSKSGMQTLAYMAKALAGIINARAPIKDRPEIEYEGEGKDRVCIVTFTTNTGRKIVHRSPPFSLIQPKNSPLWTSDPDQQHAYYTLRAAGRKWFPDILMGIYDVEEAQVERMVEVNARPSPGIAARLTGPAGNEGFSEQHVERELNGGNGGTETGATSQDEAPATEDNPAISPATQEAKEAPEATPGTNPLADYNTALGEAATVKEADVVYEQFIAGIVAEHGKEWGLEAQGLFETRVKELEAKPKPKKSKL